MLILITVITIIILLVVKLFIEEDEDRFIVQLLLSLTILIEIIASIVLIAEISKKDFLNDKIALYKQENIVIEKRIDTVVKEYLKHESDTYKIKGEGKLIEKVMAYPELKSNDIIKKQV
ncbi:MAG: hypothetical protein ACTTGJ_04190, partial [Clostridium sp.]